MTRIQLIERWVLNRFRKWKHFPQINKTESHRDRNRGRKEKNFKKETKRLMSVGEKDLDFEFRNRSPDLGYCFLRCIHFLKQTISLCTVSLSTWRRRRRWMRFKGGERSGKMRVFLVRIVQTKSNHNNKKGHYLTPTTLVYVSLPSFHSLSLLTHFLSVKTYVVNIVIFAFNKSNGHHPWSSFLFWRRRYKRKKKVTTRVPFLRCFCFVCIQKGY